MSIFPIKLLLHYERYLTYFVPRPTSPSVVHETAQPAEEG
jgi:hypothetical protein